MNTISKTARKAGLIYLIYIVISIFADVLGRSKLIVMGDAATTARNIMESAWQFRIGFVVDLVAALLFLLTAWALYALLKPVNKPLALMFLLLNLGGVAVWCVSDLFLITSQFLLSGADYLNVFKADQLQALAMLFLYIYKNGFSGIAQIFFSAWLFPLGYLVFKSGFLPKILGIILMVECFGWLMYPLQFFLFPSTGITNLSSAIGFIGEFSLTLWLLIMGAKNQKPASVDVGRSTHSEVSNTRP
jgi:hypothetical protein